MVGVSEEVRMKLTGHASPVMNSQYTHLEAKTLKDAVTKIPFFGIPKSDKPQNGDNNAY
jgi:hypothetical protein